MKTILKKNWMYVILSVFIAVYESASAFNALPFEIPGSVKKTIGVIALIGLVVKNSGVMKYFKFKP